MLGGSVLKIDLDKVMLNTARVVDECHKKGIEVLGVTKGFNAIPEIVSAVVAGGIDGLADARLENIVELRDNGFDHEITLLRIPRLSKVDKVARYADASINSEMVTIKALAQAGLELKKDHQVILMVDVGDLREGIMPENVVKTARQIDSLPGVKLYGLGTNMGCFGGILPTPKNLGTLLDLANDVEKSLGIRLKVVSGGGTSTLLLVENDTVPHGVNQIRVGEGILLGTDTTHNRNIPWLYQDAFLLKAEVIEVKSKPSVPIGDVGLDAFGNAPSFVDRGIRKRAVLALGKQDVMLEGIRPVDEKMHILGASSDHMIVDVEDSEQCIEVGAEIDFYPTYPGLLYLTGSRFVRKVFEKGEKWLSYYVRKSMNASGELFS